MPKPKCEIHVTADSVDVATEGLFGTRTSRLWFGCFMIALLVCQVYLAVFHHGRGPTILDMLAETRPGRRDFVINLIVLTYGSLIELFLLATAVRHLLPFGERLHANRTTLIWSRIPWLSFGNRWVTRTIPLSEICRASYAIVYKSKNIHGLMLDTYDKSWKTFWGIESPEANRILRGLKTLGIKVHHDPEMREDIRETLRDRRAEL
jgi:hypothetical protein